MSEGGEGGWGLHLSMSQGSCEDREQRVGVGDEWEDYSMMRGEEDEAESQRGRREGRMRVFNSFI